MYIVGIHFSAQSLTADHLSTCRGVNDLGETERGRSHVFHFSAIPSSMLGHTVNIMAFA